MPVICAGTTGGLSDVHLLHFISYCKAFGLPYSVSEDDSPCYPAEGTENRGLTSEKLRARIEEALAK